MMISCTQQESGNSLNIEYTGSFDEYKGIDTTNTVFIERHILDLDFDKKLDTIVIENVQALVGDPQIFTILKIKLATNNEHILHNLGGYKQDSTTFKKYLNRVKSELIYIPQFGDADSHIFIWDYQYPDCTAKIEIYTVSKSGVEKNYSGNLYASEIADFNDDGSIEMKGYNPCLEDNKQLIIPVKNN